MVPGGQRKGNFAGLYQIIREIFGAPVERRVSNRPYIRIFVIILEIVKCLLSLLKCWMESQMWNNRETFWTPYLVSERSPWAGWNVDQSMEESVVEGNNLQKHLDLIILIRKSIDSPSAVRQDLVQGRRIFHCSHCLAQPWAWKTRSNGFH